MLSVLLIQTFPPPNQDFKILHIILNIFSDNTPPYLVPPPQPEVIFLGQGVTLHFKAVDAEGSKVTYSTNRDDATITSDGDFYWKHTTNLVIPGTSSEQFQITAKDSCNASTTVALEVGFHVFIS